MSLFAAPLPQMEGVSDARRRIMRAVRSKDTKPERLLRSLLHREGYRFRLHCRNLPGTPDIVFPGRMSVIEVRGCFFHAHEGCSRATLPVTRRDWWAAKFARNKRRDCANEEALGQLGWRLFVCWECDLRNAAATMSHVRRFLGPPKLAVKVKGGC